MDGKADDALYASSVEGREDAGRRSEHLKILAVIMLGMVVKGTDLERADLVRLGYGSRAVYNAFRAFRRARVLKKVTRKNYALRPWVVASARRLAEEDADRRAGWPNVHDFLFVTYGMFEWDERRMDAFLSLLKKDWLHRMRASGRSLEATPAENAAKGGEEQQRREEKTYSVREASAVLGVTVRSVERWIVSGKIRCTEGSKTVPRGERRVPAAEIRRLLHGVVAA